MGCILRYLGVLALGLHGLIAWAQPGGCSPASTNPSCATATALPTNSTCVSGTTCGGGAQGTSTCLFAGSQCSWYSFTATAASMYVYIDVQVVDGCNISSNVYRATGPCTGLTQVSCVAGAPLDDTHQLTGLTVGALYYVQVCYPPGGPCGNNGSAEYCIEVGVPDPPCSTCSTPCGDAMGFNTPPTVQTVTDNCVTPEYNPPLQPGATYTFCNAFTATNTTVSFNVVITSDCGAGNVTGFSWSLYNSPSCGGAIQTGTLANLNFTGLTIGASYVFCYTFTVPAGCQHYRHCPYFVGAIVPLPVDLLEFDAVPTVNDEVITSWTTASGSNSELFIVERSLDGRVFEDIGVVEAMENSVVPGQYQFLDPAPYKGLSYYRLRQVDLDGAFKRSSIVPVVIQSSVSEALLVPNPSVGDVLLLFNAETEADLLVRMYDHCGRIVIETAVSATMGRNSFPLATGTLAQGMYAVTIGSDRDLITLRFFKD